MIKLINNILIAIGLLVNAYFMLSNGEPDKAEWWAIALIFYVWAAIPFIGMCFGNNFYCHAIGSKICNLIACLIITGGGTLILIDVFVINIDAQSGIIFAFLPFYQCVVAGIAIVLARFMDKKISYNITSVVRDLL